MIEVATGFPWEAAALVALGAVVGTFLTLIVFAVIFYVYLGGSLALWQAQDRRKRLPRTIILIRHGESKANVDTNIWKLMPDNLVRVYTLRHAYTLHKPYIFTFFVLVFGRSD